MQTGSNNFRLLNHYTILIYPFLHNVVAENRRRQIQQLEENWEPWWSRLGGETGRALDDTYFFLPYIRQVIFPETSSLKDKPLGRKYANWIKELSRRNRRGLGYFCEELPTDSVLRITYKQALLQSINTIEITSPVMSGGETGGAKLLAKVDWIDAMLFPSGIGFIMLKVVLEDAAPQFGQLIDLNYYLRTVHPPNITWNLPELNIKNVANKMMVRDLMDFLTQGMVDNDQNTYDLTQFMEHLSDSPRRRFSDSEAGQVYGERCHIFSYACIDVIDTDSSHIQADASGRSLTSIFDSIEDRLLFEFASSIPIGESSNNPMWIPTSEHEKQLKEKNQISLWQAWRAMALKESVVFLGTKDIAFNKSALAYNIENDYLPLYLFSLYQKYQLFVFANGLMRKGAYVAQHLQEVRTLMDRFMDFRNKYWFNEVTRKPLGGELYRKFQQGLETPMLYDMVSLQVKDLKEYYEEKRQQRIDILLNLFTFVFLPLGAVIGIFGMTFFTGTWGSFIFTFFIVAAVFLGIWKWWTAEFGPNVK